MKEWFSYYWNKAARRTKMSSDMEKILLSPGILRTEYKVYTDPHANADTPVIVKYKGGDGFYLKVEDAVTPIKKWQDRPYRTWSRSPQWVIDEIHNNSKDGMIPHQWCTAILRQAESDKLAYGHNLGMQDIKQTWKKLKFKADEAAFVYAPYVPIKLSET